MAATAFSLFGATRRAGLVGPAALALGTAFIIDAKLSGIVYVVPLFAIMYQLRGWRPAVLVGLASIGLAVLPFLMPNVSVVEYGHWLQRAAKHPSSFSDLLATLRTLPIWFVPLLLILGPTPWREARVLAWLREDRVVLIALSVCLAGGVFASRRIGAGSHHILPFAPVLGYEYTRLFNSMGGLGFGKRWQWQCRVASACLALGIGIRIAGGLLEVGSPWGEWRATLAMRDEVRAILSANPGSRVEMGYGATVDWRSYFRPELVFATNHLLVDEVALSDMTMDGIPLPSTTVVSLEACATVWLIPRGEEPFSLPSTFAKYVSITGWQPTALQPKFPRHL